ncbi:HAD family phosphatase [Cutibacterium sp. WCA-380-WT-3A]|uniref:HAD family phosphatase n=1 Tax=Cutibacterium porci TaxID=2605781 RepID=A0A7K0J499_9ACTN|nr:HAD family phosphatase [Cutibacterium porci]MSS44743.1 HAD family phosphatase [Cutibacterium porci]
MVTTHLPEKVDGVLFDMDGTLLDTLSGWRAASEQLWGGSLTDAVAADVDGGTVDDVVELYLRDHPQADPQVTTERLVDLLDANLADNTKPMPGADRLVRRLAAHVPIAVVSNSLTRLVRDGLASQGWLDLFDTVLGVDDVPAGKPAPDPYLAAARRMGVDPARCVVIEDSAFGLRAGWAAGAWVLALGDRLKGQGDMWVPDLEDQRVTSWEPYR